MFADNHRISSLQMERQFMMTYLGPILLMGSGMFQGRNGILGILVGAILLCIWNFFLHRHTGFYRNPDKYWGKYMGKVIWGIYQSYLFLIGGWLLYQMASVAKVYFLSGVPLEWIIGIIALVALGGCQTMQARGRLAQVSWSGICAIFVGLLLLAAFQEKESFSQTISYGAWTKSDVLEIGKNAIYFVGNLLGIVLLPFLNVKTDGQGESTKASFRMIGKITLWIAAIALIITLSFGNNGTQYLSYPLLDVMAGVHLSGGFLRRMDLVFLTFLFFSLLFSLGSIFFYSGYLGTRFGICWGRVPCAVICFLVAIFCYMHQVLNNQYIAIILNIALPIFGVLTFCHNIIRKKAVLASILCIFLVGCQVVEPEKRAYPLALGLDWDFEKEQYQMYLGMVSLAASTDQGKSDGENSSGQQGFLLLEGKNQEQIMNQYDNTQDLYLDVGHVQAVILGQNLLKEEEKTRELLLDLQSEKSLGKGAYVYQTQFMQEIFAKNGKDTSSLGQYLTGIYENRLEQSIHTNLGQVYRQIENGNVSDYLPTIQIVDEQIYVDKLTE